MLWGFYPLISIYSFDFHFPFRFQTSNSPLSLSTHGKLILENGHGWLNGGLKFWHGEQQ